MEGKEKKAEKNRENVAVKGAYVIYEWPPQERVEGDWSLKGGAGKRQPDNREEEITGKNDEACLAVLK